VTVFAACGYSVIADLSLQVQAKKGVLRSRPNRHTLLGPARIKAGKRQALEGLPEVFGNPRQQRRADEDAEKDELYRKIGQLKVELDWIKKKCGFLD
jgi:hypothetical protein